MANEFIARNGLIAQNNSVVTGSLIVSSSNSTQFLIGNQSLFISSSGDVGIGNTTPTTKLDVNGNILISSGGSRTLTMQAQGAGGTEIKLLPNSTAGFARINIGNVNAPLDFQMNSNDVMRIAQDGKVGIGTTGATAKLEVRGTGATSATTALRLQNSSLADLLTVKDDGTTTISGSLTVTGKITGTPTIGLTQAMVVGLQNIF